jgi:hypothetical protein
MDIVHTLLLTVHIIAGVSVIGLVLLQHVRGYRLGEFSFARDRGSGGRLLFDEPRTLLYRQFGAAGIG